MEYQGIAYLKTKLAQKKQRCKTRYTYYEMKNIINDNMSTIPPEMKHLVECLGWSAKAVDSMADRMSFRKFENDNFNMMEIYNMNNPDVLFDSAILSALITSCSFIYISKDNDKEYPRLQVIDGTRATGIIDPTTNMLQEGYAILEVDTNDRPILEAYFTKEATTFFTKDGKFHSVINSAPYPLLVPIIHKPDAKRPFGHARISRACMKIQQSALRTLKRSEVASEFYSFPQKYVLGLDPESETMDKWKATMSSMLRLDKDDDGDHPTVGQFQQQSMTPYVEQLKMFASLFAGETGLTLDDLGFSTENPSSVEAIKAQHENLRLAVRKAQKHFATGFINAGYLAACLRDNFPYKRNRIYLTKAKWEPIFEPDASTLSLIGDGAIKINQAVPGYFGKDSLRDLTGIEYDQSMIDFSNANELNKDDMNE
ncbi:phage portal protein [Coprobacillus sp. AF33-1AC]|uniref:phage portal protein n=1 Tax=Coprobacillus sp. AF33-1AC TaxID=2292032 RepID=UPI000E4E17F8|nr:phage portal protein [Coprobacillus sp. AF33-1AC]RHM59664.1 phage portal protein [Coprobacillus sp. AF33-1AC]